MITKYLYYIPALIKVLIYNVKNLKNCVLNLKRVGNKEIQQFQQNKHINYIRILKNNLCSKMFRRFWKKNILSLTRVYILYVVYILTSFNPIVIHHAVLPQHNPHNDEHIHKLYQINCFRIFRKQFITYISFRKKNNIEQLYSTL